MITSHPGRAQGGRPRIRSIASTSARCGRISRARTWCFGRIRRSRGPSARLNSFSRWPHPAWHAWLRWSMTRRSSLWSASASAESHPMWPAVWPGGAAPLPDADAAALVRSPHAELVLRGHRGPAPVDTAALADVLIRVGQLADRQPWVGRLVLNPVVAHPRGLTVTHATVDDGKAATRHDTATPRLNLARRHADSGRSASPRLVPGPVHGRVGPSS